MHNQSLFSYLSIIALFSLCWAVPMGNKVSQAATVQGQPTSGIVLAPASVANVAPPVAVVQPVFVQCVPVPAHRGSARIGGHVQNSSDCATICCVEEAACCCYTCASGVVCGSNVCIFCCNGLIQACNLAICAGCAACNVACCCRCKDSVRMDTIKPYDYCHFPKVPEVMMR